MEERDKFVDIAKGLGILLIVCIHTEVFDVIGMPLVFIAVPVFFYMSGFYDHSERAFSQWLPKSFRTLIIPAVICFNRYCLYKIFRLLERSKLGGKSIFIV